MILGVGTDIESVSRLKRIWEHKPALLKRLFFSSELEYAETKDKPWETLTGIWCAKESVLKSLSNQVDIRISEVEIHKKNPQHLEVIIHNEEISGKEFNFFVSISHSREYATAVCVREAKVLV
jgi:phosphopantetheine--protein transferase-like protein